MAAKRLLSNSFSDQADEPKEKRTRPTPSFTSVIGEAVMDKCLSTALEPILRRVVHEEVERSLRARIRSFSRSPSLRIQAPQPSTLELIFPKALTVPIFTGGKIVDEESNQLRVMLVDTRGNPTVPVLFPSPFKVDIVVLDGDFPSDGKNWSNEEFDRYIVKERTGKRPLLAGELVVTMRDGVGLIENIEFTDNSSWIRSRKFRIGAKVAGGCCQGVRIQEAMTEAFVVKDHLYKKHHPPTLGDEVWRLEKIGKDGVFHKRLAYDGVHTVQDFLKMWVVDHAKLRTVRPDYKVLLNPICQLVNAEINGSIYTTHNLSDINRAYLENLVRKAYANWRSLEEIEGISDEIGLLTLGDHPNHQQPMVGSSQYKGHMTDRLAEGYIPNEMQANWEISPI
ncbi:protein SAR DEFICIENT 1 [Gossypium australe]|uniref:Protein SAR DEFICIENT 1 n=1 Tax=Gossypium australe TaxID=47621 RepID=A0A5B6UUG7_9ROSI|nr:protein SAR DEFICIENT 1 [Gossypium australe]